MRTFVSVFALGDGLGAATIGVRPLQSAPPASISTIYGSLCTNCHGPTLQGGQGPSLVDAEWKYGGSDAEIFKTIKEGVKPYDVMEPWGKKLTDQEIWHTVNFLRDLAQKANAKK